MQSKGNQPNAQQKRWREQVRSLGCLACGFALAEIHHPAGVTAKFNKTEIGHWWVLGLCNRCHGLCSNPDDLSRFLWGFPLVGRWDLEKLLFCDVLDAFHEGTADQEYPSEDVIKAIKGFRR